MPDKIYVNYEQDYFVPAVEDKLPNQIEYIRKDALLEWAKEEKLDAMKKKVSSGANKDWTFYDFYKTQIEFWKNIIEHIESL